MTKLEPQEQQEAWLKAVELAGGKVPTGRIVKDVVQRIMERTKVPNTYQIGEVCQILVKDNPELRGKGSCWGIVSQVNDFSCTVKLWDGEYTVGLQYLKSFNYLPVECEQMQLISDRISRVYSDSLEETVKSLLQSLGKLNRPYLIPFNFNNDTNTLVGAWHYHALTRKLSVSLYQSFCELVLLLWKRNC
ncbi:hypothetical protein [uncultured Nostoc sp.]|uniref:hypothetical protein n=1 Tax=uncultured Nostoc sp. TaxID=340711 RepID=UPI0035CC8A33